MGRDKHTGCPIESISHSKVSDTEGKYVDVDYTALAVINGVLCPLP